MTRPVASTIVAAVASSGIAPTARIRSPTIATSAGTESAPVPSMTMPWRIRKSYAAIVASAPAEALRAEPAPPASALAAGRLRAGALGAGRRGFRRGQRVPALVDRAFGLGRPGQRPAVRLLDNAPPEERVGRGQLRQQGGRVDALGAAGRHVGPLDGGPKLPEDVERL